MCEAAKTDEHDSHARERERDGFVRNEKLPQRHQDIQEGRIAYLTFTSVMVLDFRYQFLGSLGVHKGAA